MYLKVPYAKRDGKRYDASIADVQAALSPDMLSQVEVTEIHGDCTIVDFGDYTPFTMHKAPVALYEQVRAHLRAQGFETE